MTINSSGSGVPPDQDFILALLEKIGTAAVTVTGESPIRRADDLALRIIQNAELVAALRWDVVDCLSFIIILPYRLGRIPGRSILELYDQLIDPGRIAGTIERSYVGASVRRQEKNYRSALDDLHDPVPFFCLQSSPVNISL